MNFELTKENEGKLISESLSEHIESNTDKVFRDMTALQNEVSISTIHKIVRRTRNYPKGDKGKKAATIKALEIILNKANQNAQ